MEHSLNNSCTYTTARWYRPDAPQDRYKGFSQRQIDRLNKFKADFDIMNDEMFGNYVNTWDKSLTSKKDITPANANAFLSWVENLGKMGC